VPSPNAAELLNLVGFVTGAALYAMLLVLVLRTGMQAPADGTRDRLPLATAMLGLAWNLGELAAYGLPRLGIVESTVALTALSFPALGLLAAVVVHSVARPLPYGRWLIGVGYGCSVAATLLHLDTVITGDPSSSSLAFALLTVCFGLVIAPLALLTRRQPNGRRALWILALALFAVSASHLGRFHGSDSDWLVELAGHHAAIPLAFAILYQDYRFALADLFLKQALFLLVLVSLAMAGYSLVASLPNPGPIAAGVLLVLWVFTGIVAPWLRRQIALFVDRVLLGRTDYSSLRAAIGEAVASHESESEVLDEVCRRLAPALSARRVWWRLEGASTAEASTESARTAVVTAEPPGYELLVGELEGGRRLLSDDFALVEAAGAIAARRIDGLRFAAERYERRLQQEEMHKLAAEAELRALRAQINPHFLFNALTTIGYLIDTAPPRALRTLMRLTALLRAVLRSDGEFTTLGREMDLVEHYLDIEHERFEERLRVRIDVPAALRTLSIPGFVVQPLVENAIKHGVAPSVTGGDLEIIGWIDRSDESHPRLHVAVRNTGSPLTPAEISTLDDRVGLANVRRRLEGHYGGAASLSLVREAAGATRADLELPVRAEDVREPIMGARRNA
jgi:two-component system, LytTR family, sensor kinase